MLRRRWLVVVPALALLAVPAWGQSPVELKWKFEKGKPFYQEMTTETNQTMTIQGNKVENQQKQTFYFSWTPKEKKDDSYTVVQKILGVKMDIDIAGNKISYDSTAAQQPKNPMSEFFKQLVNSEFTITIGKSTYYVTSDTKIKKADQPATLEDGVVGEEVGGYAKPGEGGKMVASSLTFGPKTSGKTSTKKSEKPK